MKRIAITDEIFDNFIEPDDISKDLRNVKQFAKINSIINKLKLYSNNVSELTKIYTSILEDDNVAYILTKISHEQIFKKHFPEFYAFNEFGENLFNCQQNSIYHKFGVFKHILATIESVANVQGPPIDDWKKKILKWTMLLHDIGKPYVKTIAEDGTESFAGHDDKSVELGKDILNRFDFNDRDKKIILTLVKYHDRFLNEGEITNDNMKFLASELNNDKELFYMLLDVKTADARSKSIEVYNKFKIVKNKYLEFINNYFNGLQTNIEKKTNILIGNNNSEKNEKMTNSELKILLDSVISRKSIQTLYQPIIDLQKQCVWGYEVFTKIECNKKIDIIELFEYAKDVGKYEKLQQVLLINGIEDFEFVSNKEADRIFVNSDVLSYEKYINKPRLYDMMSRNKVTIEFQNYEKKDLNQIQETIDQIHKNLGSVALDKFGVNSFTIEDISLLNFNYIVLDISITKNITKDIEKQKYLASLVTYSVSNDCDIIAMGVENLDTLIFLKNIGVRFVQGYYLARPKASIPKLNEKLKMALEELNQETIS